MRSRNLGGLAAMLVAMLVAMSSPLVAGGCDPGLEVEPLASELQADALAGGASSALLVHCGELTDPVGTVWIASPCPGRPDLVIVERDGEPICVDTEQEVVRRAAELRLRLEMPAPGPTAAREAPLGSEGPTSTAEGTSRPTQPGPGTRSSEIADDPIPLGKGDALREAPVR